MRMRVVVTVACLMCGSWLAVADAAKLTVDDKPGGVREWGFTPADGSTSAVNPPAFVWRPQAKAKTYELQCSTQADFGGIAYRAEDVGFNCHCPPKPLKPGTWFWRFRYVDKNGQASVWSKVRRVVIPEAATEFPMPPRDELLGRIPKAHPRLFLRPEDLTELRKLAKTTLKPQYEGLVRSCERLLKNPPDTTEPPKYPKGTIVKSETWRKIWWGNRRRVQSVLGNAATLGFTRLIGGKDEYGQLAKKLLLAAAEWDPKGATGYRYNDEAGMPYAYYFSRTYTFVHDLLSEAERKTCCDMMRIRGDEMYRHLCPRQLWTPYASHRNRAWHFLGEVGIAFTDEIPEARDWVWFAMNVFYHVYPVWCDDDGGWHEGVSYWRSYISRFTWWADVMRAAMGVDAYRKPYFSKIGYYPMYLMPPGTRGGGFGDLTAEKRSVHNRQLMTTLAAQSGNGHWQWYVEAIGGPDSVGGYVGFVRGVLPKVKPVPPTDLPTSRCFWGTGLAMMNSCLTDAKQNVEVQFKSSPFGLQSHGYEANNSFLLYAFGERLLIRTGRRDIYGSLHHARWMWSTRSTNCITVDGKGQHRHSAKAQGRIEAFHTDQRIDYVRGEAASAYEVPVDRFTRHILYIKPDLIVLFDRFATPEPAELTWWLHAVKEMDVRSQRDIRVVNDKAACHVAMVWPENLKVEQTSKFDPPPRPRVKLVEWHLTAQPPSPAKAVDFVTLIRPHRSGKMPATDASIEQTPFGFLVAATLPKGRAVIGLRNKAGASMTVNGLPAKGDVAAVVLDASGKPVASFAGE